ncbi:MAG TPA: glycoside hydrolase family 2 TIM barrel-domain containing protein [Bryobacteraceae bacterium]|nr:glycoside hydrolase family 2 TIM barrel-domain containing protein [Bryobacteraceae bacterium]
MIRILLYAALALSAAAQSVPRPEYPQPQFQRTDWLSLNGQWEFDFDNADEGLAQNWASGTRKFTRAITVPFAPETKLSGIGDTAFHPVVWYRRTLQVPAAWKGRRVLLHFGAVDYRSRVWVNGREVGSHEGGHVPFRFDITGYLKESGNTLTVRAEDPPSDRFVPRGKQYWEPKSRGIFYTRTTGIWQPVWIEAAGDAWLDRVRITPTVDGNVRFEAVLHRPDQGVEFHASINHEKNTVASAMAMSEGPRATAAAYLRNPRLWSPATPNLYDVTFELRKAGQVLDRVQSYFGFRSVSVGKERLMLNGRPVYLKMVLDQGYWPESTITPPSDEAIQYDIRLTKEMGFNGARKHQKLEDPRYLYWADKMGLLVSSEMANAYLYDDGYVARFTQEWTEAVMRDYNHPSIIMWIPINESWGVPDLTEVRQQQHLRALYTLTHSLDGSRPVIDNDGWEHTDMTDLFGIHDYTAEGEAFYSKYKRLGEPGFGVPDNARAALAGDNKYNGSPVFLSEFGGVSYIMPGQQAPEGSWGYSGLMKDQTSAFNRMAGLWNAIANVRPIMGICYTQLTDVEQEINGLLTYDRKPKFDVRKMAELNEKLR